MTATLNVENLLSELQKQSDILNKEIELRKRSEFLSHQHIDTLESKAKEIHLFANVTVHNLQAPLKIIETGIRHIKDAEPFRKNVKPSVPTIDVLEQSIHRMQHLLDTYMEYTVTHAATVSFTPLSLYSLLNQAFETVSDLIKKHNAIISYDETLFQQCPAILGDEQQLISVFAQLISNAIQFRSEAAIQLEISLEIQKALYLISFKDNGQGIDPKYFEQIFWFIKPDEQSGDYNRNSLGLAIAKKVIEHHGGKIWVSSRPSLGSTFYITLPVRE